MSLRGRRIVETATLPGGREVTVDVGLARDPYIDRRELDTVSVELRDGDELLGVLNTVLEPEQDSEALALAREIVARLESGELEPTAEAIEPLVLEPR